MPDREPVLTLAELREVIALHEELLTRTASEAGRMDLHQLLADLHRRLLSVQGRQLADAADVAGAWSAPDGRDCLLPRRMTGAAVRNLGRLARLPGVDHDLAARSGAAARVLTGS